MARYVGIDIGTTQVKVAIVRGNARKWAIERLVAIERVASEQVSVFADGTEHAAPVAPVEELLAEAAKEAAGGGDPLSVGLDGTKTYVRTLEVPAAVRRRLAEVLPFELEAQLPFDLDESVFDYRARAGTALDQPLQVLVVASRLEAVKERIDLVARAVGREPDHVAPGAFPLADLLAMLMPAKSTGARAVLDLGAESSELLIVEGSEPVFARTLSRGVVGMPATAPELAREIRQSFSAYRAAGGEPPNDVLVTGGGALIADMPRWLAHELQLQVELLPIAGGAIEGLDDNGHRFARAIGIAFTAPNRRRGLDLRRGPLAFERGYGWLREKVPMLTGLAATVLVAFFFATWARARVLNADRDVLESSLRDISKEVLGEATDDPDRIALLLSDKGPTSEEDPLPRADAMDLLVQLSTLIPTATMKHDIDKIEMTRPTSGVFRAVIQGVAPSVTDVGTIETNLKAYRCFQDVAVTKKSKAIAEDRQKYQLELEIKCPEPGAVAKTAAAGSAGAASSASGGK